MDAYPQSHPLFLPAAINVTVPDRRVSCMALAVSFLLHAIASGCMVWWAWSGYASWRGGGGEGEWTVFIMTERAGDGGQASPAAFPLPAGDSAHMPAQVPASNLAPHPTTEERSPSSEELLPGEEENSVSPLLQPKTLPSPVASVPVETGEKVRQNQHPFTENAPAVSAAGTPKPKSVHSRRAKASAALSRPAEASPRPARRAIPGENNADVAADKGKGTGAPAAGSGGADGSRGLGQRAGTAGGAVFGLAEGPSFCSFVMPDYPASARRRGISGLVVIEVALDEQGQLLAAQVRQSPDTSLEQAALKAVRTATFNPYRPGGGPGKACRTMVPIRFQLR